MRVVFAKVAVYYAGRGDTKLDTHDQMIMIKNDGSVIVNGYSKVKPLNYMGPKNVFTEFYDDQGVLTWTFDSSKENLTLKIYQIYTDVYHDLGDDGEGLIRDGTEKQLQEWLSVNLSSLNPSLEFKEREYSTTAGPVDLLAYNHETQKPVLIEVKRVAMSSSVYQIMRYLDAFEEDQGTKPEGMIIALDIRPKTEILAKKKGLQCQVVDKTLFRTNI